MNQRGKPLSSSLSLSGDSHIIRLGVSVSGESRKRAHFAIPQAAAETEKGGEDAEPRVLRRLYSEPYNSISSIFEVTGCAKVDVHYNSYLPKSIVCIHDCRAPLTDPLSKSLSTVFCAFNRARRSGCLVHPQEIDTYYTVRHRTPEARTLGIWTAVCPRLVALGYRQEILQLRIVNYQLYLISSHALRRGAAVSFASPKERYDEPIIDTQPVLGVRRILPPLPKSAPPIPSSTYRE